MSINSSAANPYTGPPTPPPPSFGAPATTTRAVCRLCLTTGDAQEELIVPCPCTGPHKYVHRRCLDVWRSVSPSIDSFYACDLCGTRYTFDPVPQAKPSKLGFYCLVFRDLAAVFLAVNLAIFAVGAAVQAVFHPKDKIINEFSATRAASESWPAGLVDFLVIYTCGGIVCLFCLGLFGIAYAAYATLKWCCDCGADDPPPPPPIDVESRRYPYRKSYSRARCDGCFWVYCQSPTYYGPGYHSDPLIGGCECCLYTCDACNDVSCTSSSDGCSGGSGGDCSGGSSSSDDGKALLIIAAIVVVAIIIIGVFVGVFLLSLLVSKIVQRRIRILNMRQRTKVYVVRDLRSDVLPQHDTLSPMPPAGPPSPSVGPVREDQPLLHNAPPTFV